MVQDREQMLFFTRQSKTNARTICTYVFTWAVFLIFYMQKACNAKIIYSRPLQTKSILILDKNFVQKFHIKSVRLPTLLILQTICVHLEIFFWNFQRKLTLHLFFERFTKKKRNNYSALNVLIKEILKFIYS